MKWGISENLTDSKVFGENPVSSSYYFGAPLRLKAYPFYTTKEDNKGNVLYEPEKVENRVMTEQVSYITKDILNTLENNINI